MSEHMRRGAGLAGRALALALLGLAVWALPAWGQGLGPGYPRYELYQAQPGDTVENIAARFGVPAELVRVMNRLESGAELAPGQPVAVPLPGAATPPSSDKGQPVLSLATRLLPPRYAMTVRAAVITSEPDAGRLLYQVGPGTRLVVKAEQGSYWGVVMVDGSLGWVDKGAVTVTERTLSAEQLEEMLRGARPDVVQEALRYLGTPYRYGGSLPYHTDCSLLVQTAFASRGMRLPRTAAAQYEVGRAVSVEELQPGDRVYFVDSGGRINHTGIYMGNGQFVHASSRRGCVTVDYLGDSFYWKRFAGARRF